MSRPSDRSRAWPVLTALLLSCCEPAEATREEAAPVAPKKPVAPPPEPAPPSVPEAPVVPPPPSPSTPASLEAAIEAATALWVPAGRTFDCGCAFTRGGKVTHGACRYETRADDEAARRLEWTHVVPPETFGSERACWTRPGCVDGEKRAVSGVDCCLATDPEFVRMHADLFNLVPMIQEIVDDRAGYPFSELDGEPRMYGRCDFEVDHAIKEVEPPDAIRGDIARVLLYMAEVYPDGVTLSPLQARRMKAWAAADPPDELERARAAAITEIQGVPNPWIQPSGELQAATDAAEAAEPTEPVEAAEPTEPAGATEAPGEPPADPPAQAGAPAVPRAAG